MLSTALMGAVPFSKEAGDRLQRKLDEIAKNGSAVPVRPKKTRASEEEMNSYLAFNAKERIPQGLAQPRVTMIGNGRLAGRVFVDLDEFRRGRSSGGFADPWKYFSGQVPLTVRGLLRTGAGKGQFQLESAETYSIPLPKPIVQELVAFFTRGPERPQGIDIEAPFDLPAQISEIIVRKGEAVIVQ